MLKNWLLALAIVTVTACAPTSTAPRNVIFMIGDGMGFEQVHAARIFNGNVPLAMERFAVKGDATTCNISGTRSDGSCDELSKTITDSAAGATAIATGEKVANGVLSLRTHQGSGEIKTILEIMQKQGKSTGLVTTKSMADATPAAFAAHVSHRSMDRTILQQYFQRTLPNVVMGGDEPWYRELAAGSPKPYQIITSLSGLRSVSHKITSQSLCHGNDCDYVYVGVGSHQLVPGKVIKNSTGLPLEIAGEEYFQQKDLPHLSDMTASALSILDKNTNGFFLMVESAMVDSVGHYAPMFGGEAPSAIRAQAQEMLEMDKTVKIIADFVQSHPDTLLVVTADHETGGLMVDESSTSCVGVKWCEPNAAWTSLPTNQWGQAMLDHTSANVPYYVLGANSWLFRGQLNNTDFMRLALQ